MSQQSFRFTFAPAKPSQRRLILRWLNQDYIRQWIHGPGLQNTLVGLEKFFQYEDKGLGFQSEITQHWIGYDGDRPFVYLLVSNLFKDIPNEYTNYSEVDGHAITLDIFIGEPDYVGKGFGAQVIKEFLLSQFSEASEVFIDPEQSNKRAVHVYQKVGFVIVGEFIASWHPVPHYIMKINMKKLTTN